MIFKEFGDSNNPTIILLHGGGLSWWSLKEIIDGLKDDYHVVAPVIDGHGEDGETLFTNIEDASGKLIQYIDTQCRGQVYAMGGLSIGAQIVTQVLSQRADIAQYAIIESALVLPMKATAALIVPMYKMLYGLIKRKWFARLQAKTLFVPAHMFQAYYDDSMKMTRGSLIHITRSNANFCLKRSIANTRAKTLILAGAQEPGIMKRSAKALHQAIPGSRLIILDKMKHGEMSLVHPRDYLNLLKEFFSGEIQHKGDSK